MKQKIIFAALLVVAFLAQWLVPTKLIYDSEATITEGEKYKFRVQPVDPYDPYRGKYITLYFDEPSVKTDTLVAFTDGDLIYAQPDVDSLGFAYVKTISKEKFAGSNYFETEILYSSRTAGQDSQFVRLNYPFTRLYLEESLAPGAEQAYWDSNRNLNMDSVMQANRKPTYALVSIKDGTAVLLDVIINDTSIVELVKERNKKRK